MSTAKNGLSRRIFTSSVSQCAMLFFCLFFLLLLLSPDICVCFFLQQRKDEKKSDLLSPPLTWAPETRGLPIKTEN